MDFNKCLYEASLLEKYQDIFPPAFIECVKNGCTWLVTHNGITYQSSAMIATDHVMYESNRSNILRIGLINVEKPLSGISYYEVRNIKVDKDNVSGQAIFKVELNYTAPIGIKVTMVPVQYFDPYEDKASNYYTKDEVIKIVNDTVMNVVNTSRDLITTDFNAKLEPIYQMINGSISQELPGMSLRDHIHSLSISVQEVSKENIENKAAIEECEFRINTMEQQIEPLILTNPSLTDEDKLPYYRKDEIDDKLHVKVDTLVFDNYKLEALEKFAPNPDYKPEPPKLETTLEVYPDTITVKKGEESTEEFKVTTNADDYTFEIDVSKASYNKDTRKVTGVEVGNTEITFKAQATGGEEVSITKQIVVEDKIEVTPPQEATQLTVTPDSITVKVNQESTETFEVVTDAVDYEVEITPSEVATFDKGTKKVTGKQQGQAKIKFKATAENKTESIVEKDITVEVLDNTQLEVTPTEKITVVETEESSEYTITTDASDYSVTFEPEGIATFNKDTKKVTGVAKGNTKMKFTAQADGKLQVEVIRDVEVTEKVVQQETTQLEVTPEKISVQNGQESTETFEVTTDAKDYEVTIDPSTIATYSKDTKKVTGTDVGTATITFTATADGKLPNTVTKNIEVTA